MPATNAWLRSRFLSSPGWRADPLAPDLEGQRRVVGVRALLGAAEARARALDAGRQQVDLAHLGRVPVADLGRGVVGGQPGGAARPRAPRRAGAAVARRRSPARPRSWPGSLSPGAASWKRPVSIGLHGDRVAVEVDQQELAAPPDRRDALADERRQLGRRAAHGERSGRLGGPRSDGRRRAAWRASATTVRSGNSGTARRL